MFCPYCGFEYTQKTNYCKRCGENLGTGGGADPAPAQRPSTRMLLGMFGAVGIFTLVGLGITYGMYDNLVIRGVRGDELLIPFVMGLMLTGTVAGLLVWQLARLVSGHQKAGQNAVVERHFIREVPATPLPGAMPEQLPPAMERPSVAEHTTRQMANVYKDPNVTR